MTVRKIALYPDPILKQKALPITKFDSKLHGLLDDMQHTMYSANGIGLAAPQVSVSKRVIVVDISDEGNGYLELINPEILTSSGNTTSEEGCLSIPDYRDTISRFKEITIRAFDRHGEQFELQADDLLSRCLQHEIDHIEGILFIDRMSRLKRELFNKWFKKHGGFENK